MKFPPTTRFFPPLLLLLLIGPGGINAQQMYNPGMPPCADPAMGNFDQKWFHYPGGQMQSRGRRMQRPGRPQDTDPRMRRRLNTVKMMKLVEYLDLSEEQAEKFFPRSREHQKEADEINRQRRELYERLQEKIDEENVSARDLDRYLAEMARLDKAHIDMRARHIQSLKDILTDEQRARFAVFNEHFRRQIRYHLQDEMRPPGTTPPDGD